MRVNDKETAWMVAKRIFPTKFKKNKELCERTGCQAYTSENESAKYDKCLLVDFGDRIEMMVGQRSYVINIRGC